MGRTFTPGTEVGPLGGKRAGDEGDGAAGGRVGGRVVALAGHVGLLLRVDVDRDVVKLREGLGVADVVHVRVGQEDRAGLRPLAKAGGDGELYQSGGPRHAGVDQHEPAVGGLDRVQVHEDRAKPRDPEGDVVEVERPRGTGAASAGTGCRSAISPLDAGTASDDPRIIFG